MDRAEQKEVKKRFGQAVRTLRKRRGLSKEAFAFECDLHRTYVGGIERGERNVALINIVRIAQTLDVRVGRLFGE